ncbi:hypothetical protein LCGC14_1528580 [marine sediment metagenome]|uniref:KH type-2 domain-containing protein n=1 Tax=marine sediment metagenome TaxID=412755 RepID=A0A0F9LC39_9ZZZZ
MFYTIADDLIFYQLLSFVKRYSNFELKLREYFYNKTEGIYPELIIIIDQFIFFFIKSENYFNSKKHIYSIRRDLANKKVLIIRFEKILINLLFSFFPDVYIHDIKIDFNNNSIKKEISIYFLFIEERGIAIGRNGAYIKAVNKLFENYIIFENKHVPLEIKCKVIV